MSKKKTTEQFIEEAIAVHGQRYRYDFVRYITNKTPVQILCLTHGFFKLAPAQHLFQRQGCRKCGVTKAHNKTRKTLQQFIAEAKEKHGDRYDYSLVAEYHNSRTSVVIICPLHGSFQQTPHEHVSMGRGCPKCGIISRSNKKRMPIQQFVAEAKEKHEDRYDYSLVKYVNSMTHVTIRCLLHGPFQQVPSSHLAGRGCPDCGFIKTGDSKRKPLEEFISQAREKHGDLYDYSLVEHFGDRGKPVIIICPIHGPFHQTPNIHLHKNGHGCPKCGDDKTLDNTRKNRLEARIAKWRKIGSDLLNNG
jgi:predicted  nucleic acid-binding Zn-ribbon protein